MVTGNFSLAGIAESVGVAILTAGITNGVTYNSGTGSFGVADWTQNLNNLDDGVKTLEQMAGTTSLVGTSISQSTGSTATTLSQQALGIATQSTLVAGVQTAIKGGSFVTNLETDAVSSIAAVGANDIGNLAQNSDSIIAQGSIGYTLAHAALGCAASAAEGTGCAGGAIGGAVSSVVAAPITGFVAQAGGDANTTLAVSAGLDALTAGGAAALLGQNPQAAVTAAANEYINNCAAGDDACKRLAEQGVVKPLSGPAFAAACGDGSQPCNTQLLGTMVQAQGANANQALANMQAMAPYAAGTLGVALLGPEALTAAALAGGFDYEGDAASYATGLSKDAPSFSKSFTTGVIGGLAYPFAIADEAIAGMSTAGKVIANGYNATVAGTAAFGAAGVTHQDNPDLSGGLAGGIAVAGSWAKAALPGPLGNYANQLIQGIAGPLQSYIQNQQNKSSGK